MNSVHRNSNSTSIYIKGGITLNIDEALGFMLLAANDAGLPTEDVMKLFGFMSASFDKMTPDEASKLGYDWFESLPEVKEILGD